MKQDTIYETTISDTRWWAYDIPGNGMFMNPGEAKLMMLAGSTLLIGRK